MIAVAVWCWIESVGSVALSRFLLGPEANYLLYHLPESCKWSQKFSFVISNSFCLQTARGRLSQSEAPVKKLVKTLCFVVSS